MSADDAPQVDHEMLQWQMNLAKLARVYFEALVAEGFTPGQALTLTATWQQSITSGAVAKNNP